MTQGGFKEGETSPIFGRSPTAADEFEQNVCGIFVETIKDYAAWEAWADTIQTTGPGGTLAKDTAGEGNPNYVVRTAAETEKITVPHEVGVAFGLTFHGDDGIMMPGCTDPAQVFKPEDLNIIRNNGISDAEHGHIGVP